MNKQDVQTLLDYHIWANRQVWDSVMSLDVEQYTAASDYSIGSLQDQMFHLLGSDWYTLLMLQGKSPDPQDPEAPQREANEERPSLRANWDALERSLQDMAQSLTDEQWNTIMDLPIGGGSMLTAPCWSLLVANMNHATNHRAQILARIHALGGDTVEQGFFFYLVAGQGTN